MAPPKIAIVGRPNVGKSSLFNLLARKRKAVIAPTPGVTIDRMEEEITWEGKKAIIIDTGGMGLEDSHLGEEIQRQAQRAMEEADICIFMVDVRDGLHPLDKEIHTLLKKSGKPYLVAVNKVESSRWEEEATAFYELGEENLHLISVLQRKGIHDLMESLFSRLEIQEEAIPQDKETIPLAIVGRPNVGKSSLLNRLLGEERVVVSETPGTTRDAIEVTLTYKGKIFVLIDTAGLRRKARVDSPLEAYSITRTVRSIKKAHICLLLVDAQEGPTTQDQKIAGLIEREKRGCLIAVSKADLLTPQNQKRLEALLRVKFHFLSHFNPIYTSAVTGKGITQLLEEAASLNRRFTAQIPTSILNKTLEKVTARYAPTLGGKRLKIYYGTQASTAPPHFLLFTNMPQRMPPTYKRYLEKALAEDL
ncbi:MAG: ribosome biogenesis GTPase Der, partial [Aquificota bacterium]